MLKGTLWCWSWLGTEMGCDFLNVFSVEWDNRFSLWRRGQQMDLGTSLEGIVEIYGIPCVRLGAELGREGREYSEGELFFFLLWRY